MTHVTFIDVIAQSMFCRVC